MRNSSKKLLSATLVLSCFLAGCAQNQPSEDTDCAPMEFGAIESSQEALSVSKTTDEPLSLIDDVGGIDWEWVYKPIPRVLVRVPNNNNEIELTQNLECLGGGLIAVFGDDKKFTVVDLNLQTVSPVAYDYVGTFIGGAAPARIGDEAFHINTLCEVVRENIADLRDGSQFTPVENGGAWGYADRTGNIAIDCVYDDAYEFTEGRAAVMKGGKWGFIDESGNICVDLIYDDVRNFSEGKAAVRSGEHTWGYIDKSGDVVIDFRRMSAVGWGILLEPGRFQGGYAIVPNDLYWIIDEAGRYVFMGDSEFFIRTQEYNAEFDAIPAYVFTDDAMTIRKYGFMRLDGSQRVEPVFDYVYGVNDDGLAKVEIGTDVDGNVMVGVIKLR